MPVVERNPKLLWNVIDLELWGRLCLWGQSPGELLESIRGHGIECAPFESIA